MSSRSVLLIVFAMLAWVSTARAKTVRYELSVQPVETNLSGKKTVDFALAVNGQIPAPTLEFTEGDDAEIVVKNEVPGQEVSIHWHGILLPPEEDGVAYVNTPPIHTGSSRTFRFKIRQHGTYWYHSHTGLQEQKGVFGAFIIHPKKKTIAADREAVVVLSDWTDENPDQVLANLRKDGDYYLYKKNSIRSIFGAARAGGLGTYFSNEWQRMGGMDLSDVGYDAFLINGKRDLHLLEAHPGERVRLRIINAGASSYFYVSLAGLPMTVVSADGVDITPVQTREILMGMAETYDVLFTVPEHKNYELRATVQDVTGHASAWIGMGEKVKAPDKPFPDLYAPMSHGADHSGHGAAAEHSAHATTAQADEHAGHAPPPAKAESHADHSAHAVTPKKADPHAGHGAPAQKADPHAGHASVKTAPPAQIIETLTVDGIKAAAPTAFPKNSRFYDVKLVLDGSMERYVWHINGKTIDQDRTITINEGDVVRFTLVNNSMMHHPMHLHGHFFRVVNANGESSPLKHTVDVPPHGTRTIEFMADEPGDWMFHCHNLFHMKTGMARVVKYSTFTPRPEIVEHQKHDPHLHDHIYRSGFAELATNHAQLGGRLIRTWDQFEFRLESSNPTGKNFAADEPWENEGDLLYRRFYGNFYSLTAGGTLYHEKGYGMIGVGAVLPMLVDANLFVNHEGRLRLDLEKKFQWTSSVFTDVDLSWRPGWKGDRETEYEITLMYGPSWHWAAGLMVTAKNVGLGFQAKF